MQKITPFLWYDNQAQEAAEIYTSAFQQVFPSIAEQSKIISSSSIENTPSGTVQNISIELFGQRFQLMSAGPYFSFTPAVSFLVVCKTAQQVDELWHQFSKGGKALMALSEYPFSKRYGWIMDKFGLSWQIILLDDPEVPQKIVPTLMFAGENCGKAEEAMHFYTNIFDGKIAGEISRYKEGGPSPDKPGTIEHANFLIKGLMFGAMDSAYKHEFNFTEATSFVINCEDQKEIDYYWEKLSAVPDSEQCGWVKDKYGVSWQIVPTVLNELLSDPDKEKANRATQAMLTMKKLDIQKLKDAYNGV